MKNEDSVVKFWRPAMAWAYIAINLFDFIIAPMFVLYLKSKGIAIDNWKSLTLENGGFIHVAFGAVLGIYAHGRTREKMKKSEEPE